MRIFSLFFWTSIILLIFTGIAFVIYNVSVEDNFFKDQAYKRLINVADSKSERVADFLENRKNDAEFLAESKDVKDIFDEKVVRDVELVSNKIKNIGIDTAKDIEEYIIEHPEMSLDDLRESKEFNEIAVRPVGKSGYTYLTDVNTGILYFHPDVKIKDTHYGDVKTKLPIAWKLLDDSIKNCSDSSGFYDWVDINGVLRQKFAYYTCVDVETSDGHKFIVGSSTYVDEYGETIQLASDLDKEFKSFQELKGYSDLIFISPEGNVVWTAERHDELGTNLESGIYNESLLANMFREARDNLEIDIGYSNGYTKHGELTIFITAPIMAVDENSGKGELKGILALRLDNSKIFDLIINDVGLGEKGEVYIINQIRDHVTPLKIDTIKGTGQLHHTIVSERIESCFKDYDNYYASLKGERVNKVSKFGDGLNYVGEEVLGAHSYVLGSGWCVIAEMSKSDFEEDVNRINIILAIIILSVFFVGILVAFILDNLYKIERKGAKK